MQKGGLGMLRFVKWGSRGCKREMDAMSNPIVVE
jgi:hypothetical protein